jgi:hypothetical protein
MFYEHAKSAQKKFSAWKLKSRVETSSRLWASMGVAAFVAVLAVGAISGARHYAYRSYTAQHSERNTSPVTPAVQDMAKPRSTSTMENDAPAATPQPRSSVAEKSRIRKVRSGKHDDYVARDTYVYYGNKGGTAK